jgi:uncharacterized protein YsxB (DUF464 family)
MKNITINKHIYEAYESSIKDMFYEVNLIEDDKMYHFVISGYTLQVFNLTEPFKQIAQCKLVDEGFRGVNLKAIGYFRDEKVYFSFKDFDVQYSKVYAKYKENLEISEECPISYEQLANKAKQIQQEVSTMISKINEKLLNLTTESFFQNNTKYFEVQLEEVYSEEARKTVAKRFMSRDWLNVEHSTDDDKKVTSFKLFFK